MRLYHGSNQIVERPMILEPKHSMDYGKGFYTTESYVQAHNWAIKIKDRRKSNHAYVSQYEFDLNDELKLIVFEEPTEEWFDFVYYNRVHMIDHEYDLVIGPVADDGVYETIFEYESGVISKETAIRFLKSAKLDNQVTFHTDKSLECIRFIGYKELD